MQQVIRVSISFFISVLIKNHRNAAMVQLGEKYIQFKFKN
jgi:hypothetical protein